MTEEERKKRERDRLYEWRRKNPEKIREHKRRDQEKNRDKYAARNRARYQNNREKILAENREKYRGDPTILERNNAYRRANPGKVKSWYNNWKKRVPNGGRLSNTKKQAKQKGLRFDLDIEWFDSRINAGVCELSGLPFDLTEKYGVGGRGPNSPSVDRKDPKGPYTKENCRMILWWLNRALVDLGDEYAMRVFRGIFVKRGEM